MSGGFEPHVTIVHPDVAKFAAKVNHVAPLALAAREALTDAERAADAFIEYVYERQLRRSLLDGVVAFEPLIFLPQPFETGVLEYDRAMTQAYLEEALGNMWQASASRWAW